MSFNGSGVAVINSSGQPVVASTLITAAAFNAFTADVATMLSTCVLKDGQQTITADIPMNSNKLTGLAAATARTDAASLATIQDGTGVYVGTVGGTADAITLTPAPAITAYAAGQTFRFIASGANTGAATVAVSGLASPKAITKNGTTALVANDILSGMMVQITYDGTRFILGTHLTADVVTLTGTQVLTNKTLTSPTLNTAALVSPTLSGTPIFPDNVFTVGGSGDASKKVAFEVDGLTTATTRTLTVQDEDGTVALTSEFDYANLAGSSGRMPLPAMWIQGLTYSNNAGDATNDLDIAAGQCRDATNAHNLIVSALTKQSDAAWAVGTNQGGLDTGAVGNSEYYIFAIKRSDTGVCDVLYSLSSTAPTMPANYDYKRLIGWFKRTAGAIVTFTTYETMGGGLDYAWKTPTLDINSGALTTSRLTAAVKVPQNFSTIAHLRVVCDDAGTGVRALIMCPDETDTAASETAAPLFNVFSPATSFTGGTELRIRTSATGTISARAAASVDAYRVVTQGFTWARRN